MAKKRPAQLDLLETRADDLISVRADSVEVRPESREVDVIASTEMLDSFGTVLRQNWRLERFLANPVVLWAHDRTALPIGTAKNVKVSGNKSDGKRLTATLCLRDREVCPKAGEVLDAFQDGSLKGVSVGFRSHASKWEKEDDREFLVLDDNELLEISPCAVPANPETLAVLRSRMLAEREDHNPTPATGATQPEIIMPDFAPFCRALQLAETSTEAEIVERLNVQSAGLARLLEATDQTTVDGAVGAVSAMRTAAEQATKLTARVAELEQAAEAQEREAVISKLRTEGKCTPAQEKDLFPTLNLTALSAFAGCAPVIVKQSVHTEAPKTKPATGPDRVSHDGRTYEAHKPTELAALKRGDVETYTALRQDWERAGKPAAPKS
jgi:HK97 family phage prohead protease